MTDSLTEHELKQKFLKKKIAVIGGGASQALAAMQYFADLQTKGWLPKFDLIVANSAGSFAAILLAFNFNLSKIIPIIEKSIEETPIVNLNPLSVAWNFLFNGSVSTGNNLEKIIARVYEEEDYDTHMTFADVYKKHGTALCFTTIDIGNSKFYYLSPWTTPDLSVLEGIICATSLTPIFSPRKAQIDKGGAANHFVDSGYVSCYPHTAIDPNNVLSITRDPRYVSDGRLEEITKGRDDYLGIFFCQGDVPERYKSPPNMTYFYIPILDHSFKIILLIVTGQILMSPDAIYRNTSFCYYANIGPFQFISPSVKSLKKIMEAGSATASRPIQTYLESNGRILTDIRAFYNETKN